MTIDVSRYLADQHRTGSTWWLFKFPSGRTASVIPDPRPGHPFRFEVQVDDEQPRPGRTSAEVEDLLAALALAEPQPEPTVALVTVNEMGELTPESTVTLGEFTWPVPERTEEWGVYAPPRLNAALAERGYRRAAGAGVMDGGYFRVPVEKIEVEEEG